MKNLVCGALAVAVSFAMAAEPVMAQGRSSGRKEQDRATMEIPRCTRNLGTVAIVEPDNQWWREFNLGSPEAILRVFVQKSGCFTLVNRGRSMQSRAMERALADQGELQEGSNLGKGQVKAADYFLQPDIVSANSNSGGGGGLLGGVVGGLFGRTAGALAGGISVKKGEANVTLSIVNARTTVEEALVEGYFRKKDLGWAAGGGLFGGGGGAAGGFGSYENTAIGQIIVLAYLNAYSDLVYQLGGLPGDASAAAPEAQ
ncbi:penicillin-binding protein activator LpoB [Qipengyuania sp. 6B39]|uniref:CsgG/HfaB family protein n=1 Tax=Qipengyuania proteolytica TaxID=2867239 RepID=UPI001C898677|nr:CsgG/HfaB family protein [Qipengyuania proteolytica]MBX7494511.1 penicillin-binding protein activator LpoB [Qipengyuania proteolytica]